MKIRRALNWPHYGAVALTEPQQSTEVWLEGDGEPLNVTRNNVVAALKPFTVAVMLKRTVTGSDARLTMRAAGSGRPLGSLRLTPTQAIPLRGGNFQLFEMAGSENNCVSRVNLLAYHLSEKWRMQQRQKRNPHNFRMTIGDIWCSHVFYTCPRPVVLVTVEREGAGNMFPMDLIGPTDSPFFSMALRLTSPAVKLMEQSRRMALASVPYSYKNFAYELGRHHSQPSIEWSSLPFPVQASPCFGLPVAQAAPRVREVQVEETHQIGSHMLFLTSVVGDSVVRPADELLFHAFYGERHPPTSHR